MHRAEGPTPPDTTELAGAVRTVSGLTLASRVLGLVRDLVTVRLFGDTAVGSAFHAAFAIPNVFRRLFGEGALTAAFIPEYAELSKQDPEQAGRLATIVLAALALATGLLTVLIEVACQAMLWLTPFDADRVLLVRLLAIMAPFMPAVCVTAVLGGMLQVHGRFAPAAAAPIVLNVLVILAAASQLGGDPVRGSYVVASAVVLAGLVQVAWAWGELRGRVTWARGLAHASSRAKVVLKRYGPALIGMGTLQLNTLLDTLLATWPLLIGPTLLGREYPLDEASNAVLGYTQRLYQFPLGVFGIAVATAAFPLLSKHANDRDLFLGHLRHGLRLSLFIALPASIGLVVVRDDLTTVMLTGGANGFSSEGAARAARVLLAYAGAVWAYSLNHVLTRAFYARGDTTTPMRVALAMVGLNLSLNLVLIWPLGEAGLAWSTALCAALQCVLLTRLLSRRLSTPVFDRGGRARATTLVLAAAAMGASVWAAGSLAERFLPDPMSWTAHLLRLLGMSGAGAALYLGWATLARVPEWRLLLRRV